jgi:hypothetical protein
MHGKSLREELSLVKVAQGWQESESYSQKSSKLTYMSSAFDYGNGDQNGFRYEPMAFELIKKGEWN